MFGSLGAGMMRGSGMPPSAAPFPTGGQFPHMPIQLSASPQMPPTEGQGQQGGQQGGGGGMDPMQLLQMLQMLQGMGGASNMAGGGSAGFLGAIGGGSNGAPIGAI